MTLADLFNQPQQLHSLLTKALDAIGGALVQYLTLFKRELVAFTIRSGREILSTSEEKVAVANLMQWLYMGSG